MQHIYSYNNFRSHGNQLFSSPLWPDIGILVILSLENIKQGYELKLMCLYACWIMQMRHHWQISI